MTRGNERLCCEAVLQILERRADAKAGSVLVGGRAADIDLEFVLLGQKYAVDHTLIDPYEDRTYDDVQLMRVLDPIVSRANAERRLPQESSFALLVESRSLLKLNAWDIQNIQARILDWVFVTVPSIPCPANLARTDFVTSSIEGVPFKVSLPPKNVSLRQRFIMLAKRYQNVIENQVFIYS